MGKNALKALLLTQLGIEESDDGQDGQWPCFAKSRKCLNPPCRMTYLIAVNKKSKYSEEYLLFEFILLMDEFGLFFNKSECSTCSIIVFCFEIIARIIEDGVHVVSTSYRSLVFIE